MRTVVMFGTILTLAGVSMLFGNQSAVGAELVRERFDRISESQKAGMADGKDARSKGWSHPKGGETVVNPLIHFIPVKFAASRKGSISFDLQRKGAETGREERGTIFALVMDGNEDAPFFLQVNWSLPFAPDRPLFTMGGEWVYRKGAGLWSMNLLSDRVVRPGEWVHVDLTWDDEGKKYGFYLDGHSQDTTPRIYDSETGKSFPDKRLLLNTEQARYGNPLFEARPFSELLATVSAIDVGLHRAAGDNNMAYFPLANAVVSDFVVRVGSYPPGIGGGVSIRAVSDDSFKVPGISGKLVAGDKVNVTLVAAPGGKASFDMGRVKGIPMEEVPPRAAAPGISAVDNGTYVGSYTIRPGDEWENGQVVGNFVSADNVVADNVVSASKWTIDTKPRVTFSIDRKDLPADSSTKARVKLVAKDANGNPVKGRRLKLTLATTDQYTGTVGAGDFGKQVGGSVENRWRGETDSWGEVEFDYTAGFAAKTVILTAKDLDSGGVSVDYVTAYKEASIDIALTKVISRAAMRRSVQYVLKVEASRSELTADGRSRSVIRATLLDPNGTTVPGDPIAFTLSSPNGTLRTIQGTTDSSGVATAEYTAGKRIGIVVISATATLRNAQGQVSIILLADAPAKIRLAAKPDSLPADGMSRADIHVKVTDINDNPNRDTKVEFKVAKGGGKLEYPDRTTDQFGDAANRYTAGTEAGVATILATVRSTVPTEAELAKARNVLFVPYNPDSEEIRVEKWLKKKGDAFTKDEPLVEYTVGRQKTVNVLTAPYDGTMREILVEYWDNAEVGQSLAVLEPVNK